MMSIAREGLPFIAGAAVLAVMSWVAWYYLPVRGRTSGTLLLALAVVLSFLTLFCLWFFRDPDRTPPEDPRVAVAPADGKVLSVGEVEETTFMGGPARRVTIFLSIFDVHVQRIPASGTVRHYEYRPGEYLVAWEPKASELNEQASLGIQTEAGPVLVRQIAGLVARRIVTRPRPGDPVSRGERYGLIRFGSRVDLFLPLDWQVLVEPGERVWAGRTAIGRMP